MKVILVIGVIGTTFRMIDYHVVSYHGTCIHRNVLPQVVVNRATTKIIVLRLLRVILVHLLRVILQILRVILVRAITSCSQSWYYNNNSATIIESNTSTIIESNNHATIIESNTSTIVLLQLLRVKICICYYKL